MDEVRRFLRYTLLGLAVIIELLIALFLTDTESMGILICKDKDQILNLGLVLTIFIGSGGLGYLFASLYFELCWIWPFYLFMPTDHLALLTKLREKKIIEITDASGKSVDKLSKREAWIIVTQYWCSRLETSNNLKGVNSYILLSAINSSQYEEDVIYTLHGNT